VQWWCHAGVMNCSVSYTILWYYSDSDTIGHYITIIIIFTRYNLLVRTYYFKEHLISTIAIISQCYQMRWWDLGPNQGAGLSSPKICPQGPSWGYRLSCCEVLCSTVIARLRPCQSDPLFWPVHLLSEDVSSREDASTSWPSSSGLRGRRRTYLTI
jgi:hypothetical protein